MQVIGPLRAFTVRSSGNSHVNRAASRQGHSLTHRDQWPCQAGDRILRSAAWQRLNVRTWAQRRVYLAYGTRSRAQAGYCVVGWLDRSPGREVLVARVDRKFRLTPSWTRGDRSDAVRPGPIEEAADGRPDVGMVQ